MRILYVEDDPVDADLTERCLSRHSQDFILSLAGDYEQAVRQLQDGSGFDLVMVDLRLPGVSGLELLAYIREHQLPLAVVLLTGSGDPASAIAALQAGADDYLIKSGDYLQKLPHTLNLALERYREGARLRERTLRVLYVEPNPGDIELTRRHISRHAPHIRLTLVSGAAEALRRLPDNDDFAPDFDILLADYRLYGDDALALLKTVRHDLGLDLPIVFVSAIDSQEIIAQALRLGVSDYLVKSPGYLLALPAILEKNHRQAEFHRQQKALSETSRRLYHLLETHPTVIYSLRLDGTKAQADWVSDNIEAVLGYSVAETLTPGWWQSHLHDEDREAAMRRFTQLLDRDQLIHFYRFQHKDGSLRWIRDQLSLQRDPAGAPTQIVGSWNDVTEQVMIERQLNLDAAVLESTRDGVLVTDARSRIIAVNRALAEISGYEEHELIGQTPRLLRSGRHDDDFYAEMWQSLLQMGFWEGEVWNRRKSGEIFPTALSIRAIADHDGNLSNYVGVSTDISKLKNSEAQIEHLAHYDALTDLPNRLLLHSQLEYVLQRARRYGVRVGVLFIDLDQFKTINDGLGHPVGDELLAAVARRLQGLLSNGESLGRLGGDEFLLIVDRVGETQELAAIARRIQTALATSFELPSGPELYIRASIGISIFPDDADTGTELIRDADSAMHQAKQQNRNTYCFYTESLTLAANHRLELEMRLRRAVENNEFVLHYQPLVEVRSQRAVGVEALVRWQPGPDETIPPDHFIPLAEETGAIVPIGQWVLRTACIQAKAWLDAGLSLHTLSVNLSVRQLGEPDIVDVIAAILAETGLPAACLELEITESGLMAQGEKAEALLNEIKRMGIRIAIDDFGTGYSSLAYLSRLPIDKLKIDRSFIRDIPNSENDREIAATVIAMARNLKLSVLAEGVETDAQMDFLRQQGCDLFQGYWFSPPRPAGEITGLLTPA